MGGKPKAMVAMSGGVDSSVAALLAMRMGYECTGVTMKLFGNDGGDAARVAASLGIPHETIDLKDEFLESVIEPFVSAYEAGETPNPCVECNIRLKFGLLFDRARAMGFDKLVTGHYARVVQAPEGISGGRGGWRLERAADAAKDQSYFLYGIAPEKLEHIIFPLGGLTKKETRALAAEAGFKSASAKESQDICFIGDGGRAGYAGFIESFRGEPSKPGNFVDTSGRIIGRHGGVIRYTIGQRKGLGVAVGRPVYVKDIRPETGEVVLADEKELFVSRIEITGLNWQSGEGPRYTRAEIMIRYGGRPAWAAISALPDGNLLAEFDEPVRAPAKGQSAVLYDGDLVLGGGRIG